MNPAISVVVCTYNRAEILADCIGSLLAQETSFEFDVVVVDDGSTDETIGVLQELRHRDGGGRLRWSSFLQNRGLNAARNEGVSQSTSEFVQFFDDDQLAPEGFLTRVHSQLTSGAFVAVGGPIREAEGGPRTCRDCSVAGSPQLDSAIDVRTLYGGNMAISRPAFERYGMFDEALSGRGDESEWFARLDDDARLRMVPELWIWHRRDHTNAWRMCLDGYRQGQATPAYQRSQGSIYRFDAKKAGRYLRHGLVRRCANGWLLLARELGALRGSRRRRGRGAHPA